MRSKGERHSEEAENLTQNIETDTTALLAMRIRHFYWRAS
jgi:hypothetical protein